MNNSDRVMMIMMKNLMRETERDKGVLKLKRKIINTKKRKSEMIEIKNRIMAHKRMLKNQILKMQVS